MVQEITVHELAEKLRQAEPVVLVDVRQPWEHETAALPNDRLIPLNELPDHVGEINPSEAGLVVVYCHHGIRSLSGAAYLEQAGVRNVASLAGGIDAWSIHVDPGVPRY